MTLSHIGVTNIIQLHYQISNYHQTQRGLTIVFKGGGKKKKKKQKGVVM